MMASSTPNCSICELRYVNNPSEVWCSECSECLCENCRDHHALSRSTRNHKTITIDEYLKLPEDILNIKEICDKHDEKFQLFCRSHNCPCCRVCVTKDHVICEDKVLLENVIKNVKVSNDFEETVQLLSEILETVRKIRKDRENNVKTIREKHKSIEQSIREARIKINDHLDKIEEELRKELTIAEDQITTQTNDLITSLDKEKNKLTEYQTTLANLKKYGSELQTYCALNKIQDETRTEDQFLQSLFEQEKLNRSHVSVTMNSNLLDAILTTRHFGEIKFESKPTTIKITRSKDNLAQIMVIPTNSIDNIRVTVSREIKTQGRLVRGCLLLPGNTAAISCSGDNIIKFFDKDDSKISEVKTGTKTFDMVYIEDSNSIAVTSGIDDKHCITIIDNDSKKVKKTIPVGSYNYGITYRNNTLYFCAHDKGLRMINLRDNSVSDVGTGPLDYDAYVATYNDKLYYTDWNSNTVTCCDLQGQTLWRFKDLNIRKFPLGIDCDNDGNIYVVDFWTNNVVVISSDGKRCRQLLTDSDGLKDPNVLHFNRSKNNLLVANECGTAFVFDVKK